MQGRGMRAGGGPVCLLALFAQPQPILLVCRATQPAGLHTHVSQCCGKKGGGKGWPQSLLLFASRLAHAPRLSHRMCERIHARVVGPADHTLSRLFSISRRSHSAHAAAARCLRITPTTPLPHHTRDHMSLLAPLYRLGTRVPAVLFCRGLNYYLRRSQTNACARPG